MDNHTCSIDECDRPVKRFTLCYGHYMKQWRYGTPTPIHPPKWVDLRGQRFGTLVVESRSGQRWVCRCDCGGTRTVNAGDLNRWGDAVTCGDHSVHRRRDVAGYAAAHGRVRTDRGSVHAHSCVDCGRPAQHWSYNHDDPDELLALGLSARPIAYSLKPQHYSPRCVRCHKVFDLGRIDSAQTSC